MKIKNETMTTITISRNGTVTDRQTGRELGNVHRIDWPTSRDGQVNVERRWEARKPHQTLVVNHFGFPTFATRREAAEWLAQ